jgi:uncharacterized protein
VGVEIREPPVSDEEFAAMEQFVRDYLQASVATEEDGGRMRWYPWHSAEYRFNHIRNVVDLAAEIARGEEADVDVARVAALFHDVAKLEVEQDRHAEAGARIAREYLETHTEFPQTFVDQVCRSVREHSHQGDLAEVSLETQCLIEADLLDKVGANGAALMMLRMGYESRTHMDAATMVGRVLERGKKAEKRVQSQTADDIAHRRLTRVRWFQEWLDTEVAGVDIESPERERE